jgi:GT2 family glycosyltransferase
MSQPSSVAIIVLNWNQFDDTAECLQSLRALRAPNCRVIVVDNGSVDGSPERIEAEFTDIILLRNDRNLGFAEGNNVGIRYAMAGGATHLFLLNNDTVVARDVVDELLWGCNQDALIGAVGAVNYSYYDRQKVISGGGKMNWWTSTHRLVLPSHEHRGARLLLDTDCVGGSAMFITRTALDRVGLLDREYFNFYEETDWCLRAKAAGLRVALVASAKVWHKVSAAMPSAANAYFCARNSPRFMRRNAPRASLPFYYAYYLSRLVLLRVLARQVLGRRPEARATWLGFIDAIARRYGAGRIDDVLQGSARGLKERKHAARGDGQDVLPSADRGN